MGKGCCMFTGREISGTAPVLCFVGLCSGLQHENTQEHSGLILKKEHSAGPVSAIFYALEGKEERA